MATIDRRQTPFLNPRRPPSRRAVVGVDGGGTKTHAVILDNDLSVLGEGRAGPSNPLRVGISNACAAIREAVDKACEVAKIRRTDLIADVQSDHETRCDERSSDQGPCVSIHHDPHFRPGNARPLSGGAPLGCHTN